MRFKVTGLINNTRQTIGEYPTITAATMAKSRAMNAGYEEIEVIEL